jgi:hypothetical protein
MTTSSTSTRTLCSAEDSQTWLEEAMRLLGERPDVLVCQPFPGPPRPDGRVHAAGAELDAGSIPALRFRTITTRYFLIDRNRLGERIDGLAIRCLAIRSHSPVLTKVRFGVWWRGIRNLPLRDRLRPLMLATPRVDLPERLRGEAMATAEMHRVDYLGASPGCGRCIRESGQRFTTSSLLS